MVNPILIELFNYSSRVMSLLLILTLAIFVPLLIWKLKKRSRLTFIHSSKSKLKRIPYFTRLWDLKFTPSIFCPSGNMQNAVLSFYSSKENSRKHLWTFEYKRESLSLSDGTKIALDWAIPRNPELARRISDDKTPMLVVVPGLSWDRDDLYMVSTALEAVINEYQLVMINHNEAINSKLTTPKFYWKGTTNDLEQTIEYISSTYPKRDLFLLGFSLGANTLTNYLGKHGDKVPAKAAMCIGNPYDPISVSDKINGKTSFEKIISRIRHLGPLKKYWL